MTQRSLVQIPPLLQNRAVVFVNVGCKLLGCSNLSDNGKPLVYFTGSGLKTYPFPSVAVSGFIGVIQLSKVFVTDLCECC